MRIPMKRAWVLTSLRFRAAIWSPCVGKISIMVEKIAAKKCSYVKYLAVVLEKY